MSKKAVMKTTRNLLSRNRGLYRLPILVALVGLLAACASIGRPEGGPRDEVPPVFVRSNPAPSALNVNRNRVEIYFDENIQLDDAFNKVIVSPVQGQAPVVRSLGRRVTVELRDTLVPDETYTIDFGDAIKDLNEGNVLDGFALDFATGNTIDSLRVSGMLFEARTLEPAQGILVGIYSNPADSAIRTLPLERVARTNTYGQFTVRGLKPGAYRIFAVNDKNNDKRWDRSEDVAFYDLTVSPSVIGITVNDTLRDVDDNDSIVTRPGVAYLPDDILLTWFNENYRSYYIKDNARPDRRRATLVMSAPCDTAPTATIVNTPGLEGVDWNSVTVADIPPTNDSITWWIRDPRVLAADSLSLAVRHPQTDTLDRIVWQTDTLRYFYRPTSDEKKKAKEAEKRRKEGTDTIPPEQIFMSISIRTQSEHEIYDPLIFESSTPWGEVDTTKMRLSMYVDTVLTPVGHGSLTPIPGESILSRRMTFKPEAGVKYLFEADSAAFFDIYGNPAKGLRHEFTVKTPDKYSKIVFSVTPGDTMTYVELLDASDRVVKTRRIDPSGNVVFENLNPGKYYARLFYDTDGNGEWTTGNIDAKRQPEEVAYYPKRIDARANWDIDLVWDVYGTPVDKQKPREIVKNKPKLKKGEKEADYGEDGEEVDEWGNPVNDRRGNNRNNSTIGNPLGGRNGFQQVGSGNTAQPRR